MPGVVNIRRARAEEGALLVELQRRASLHWPDTREALMTHPDAIELPPAQIGAGLVRVAEEGGRIVAFSVLLAAGEGDRECELDGLFVEPDRMGGGLGRLLIEDAARSAAAQGAVAIAVIANPNALGFYERVGFRAGEQIATRFGPGTRMRLALSGAGATR